jgi:hypothetical protein
MKQSDRTLIGSAYSWNRSASPRSTKPIDQFVGQARDHALRAFLDVAGAEGHVRDRPDPPLLGALHAEHVLAHRAVELEGSVAAVNVSGSFVTRFTSSCRVTSQRPTAGTKFTGSSSRRRA